MMDACQPATAAKGPAFTLIELLVVTAVVALLASLLLPTLSRVKEKARGVECASNLQQMTLTWTLYAQDSNDGIVLNLGDQARADGESWVRGTLTLDVDYAPAPAADSTNVLFLLRSPLAPYGAAPGIWRCPSDKSTRTIGNRPHPRIRSITMNTMLGTARCTFIPPMFQPWKHRIVQRMSDFQNPGPARCFVFLDEREDSIYESKFQVAPSGLRPPSEHSGPPDSAQYRLINYPGGYHGGAGSFGYADGHVEAHKWLDPRTRLPLRKDHRLPGLDPVNGVPSPGNPDVAWLQVRTFQMQD
ncbi:MAG: prepilin-type N-terminal cleavage/methylation domain-containing protein [Verrucomicrobia bacterium]|nr:prepilin-type N-terminal cleavage/methylation domain-containing protein [Verrucomicrobiota bacterium]